MSTISIKEVAEKVGLSVGTVSHVLNGNESARISKATQERVRQAAAEMGYRPNLLARSLGRRRMDTIGLLVSGLKNPFFVDVMESAETAAVEAGYKVILDAAPSFHGTYKEHSKIIGWPVDGVVMWAHSGQTLAEYLGQGATVPVVYMGFAREDDSDYVAFDLYSGARELAEHLVERGYERIAYVSAYAIDKSSREDRYRAYRDVCALNNLPTELLVTEDERETREAGLALGRAIAAMPAELRPQALMCHNDVIAVGLYCGLRRSGLRVPEDIAVAGFDGIEEAQYLDVPLTTVRTPGSAIAQQAVQILSRRLAGDVEDGPCQVLLPAQLLIGGST